MDILTHPFHLVLARDAQWPLVTRDGRKAEVLKWNCHGPTDILAYLWDDYPARYDNSGRAFGHSHDFDLFLSADYSDPDVRVAVQKAHEKLGMEVLWLSPHPFSSRQWQGSCSVAWLWSEDYQYRLAQHVPVRVDPIAPGHNPDRLTVSQVGEGWRLLESDELTTDRAILSREPHVQLRCIDGTWANSFGHTEKFCQRTRLSRAELAALDAPAKPEIIRWDCADDIPGPICFIRAWDGYWAMIVAADADGFYAYHPNFPKGERHRYCNLGPYLHSTDLKEWKPCTKEVRRG